MRDVLLTSDFPKVKKYGSPSIYDRINLPSPVSAEILETIILHYNLQAFQLAVSQKNRSEYIWARTSSYQAVTS